MSFTGEITHGEWEGYVPEEPHNYSAGDSVDVTELKKKVSQAMKVCAYMCVILHLCGKPFVTKIQFLHASLTAYII